MGEEKMTTRRDYQRMEKRLRKSLFAKHEKFERSKTYWKKMFDKAYPDEVYGKGLWKIAEECMVDYEMLPQWEKNLMDARNRHGD